MVLAADQDQLNLIMTIHKKNLLILCTYIEKTHYQIL
jgi:hypothetical protein